MNLLITGAFSWSDEQKMVLKNMGFNIIYIEREDIGLDIDLSEIEAVVCNWLFVHHNIEKFTGLRFVQLLSAGLDRIPMAYIQKNNIKLFNAKGVYSIPMAEFAIGGVLQLYKGYRGFYDNQKIHFWKKNRNLLELENKNVCIIGTGSVGNEVAKRFYAFGCRVYGVDLYPRESDYYTHIYCFEQLDNVLSNADIVVLTAPLTEKTTNMFNRERFDVLKRNSVIVNISRGKLVDEKALCEALETKLLGAIIDVFEEEPLGKDSHLWDYKNLVVSPHNSFVSENNDKRMWNLIHSNLSQYVNSERGI